MTPTVSACWAGMKPGAMIVLTSHGATRAALIARMLTTRTTKLVIALANRQAPGRSSAARKSAKTGMNAVASAPPATMVKSKSGSLKAAK